MLHPGKTNTLQKEIRLMLQRIQEAMSRKYREIREIMHDTDVGLGSSQQMTMKNEEQIQKIEEKPEGVEEINEQMIQADKETKEIVKISEMDHVDYLTCGQRVEEGKERDLPEVMTEIRMGVLEIRQREPNVEEEEILRLNISDVKGYKIPREELSKNQQELKY